MEKQHRFQKNEECLVRIEDVGTNGEGIGHVDGYALFVKDTIVGDVVRVRLMKTKKNYGYARVVEIVEPSPDRVEPKCPLAKSCGGCQLQAWSYDKQLAYKENKVKNLLERIGGIQNADAIREPIIGMSKPYYYRNKAQFPVGAGMKDTGCQIGFYASRTHCVMDTQDCLIQAEGTMEVIGVVRHFLDEFRIPPYDEQTHTGLVRHIMVRIAKATGQVMVCLVINGTHLPQRELLVARLQDIPGMTSISINCNREKTNVILGSKTKLLWGDEKITDQIGEVSYRISPQSFYQVNPEQTMHLYETALDYAELTGEETVWDLYCGIGTISLFLAQKARKVYGVEIVPQAIQDAKENAELNNMDQVEFFVGAAEEVMPQKYKESGGTMRADVVVVDPPRKGCEESLLDTVVSMEPKRIVYVSCDPATLARDVKYLGERGYELTKYRPCDMFGHSVHVESVCLLSKVQK